MADPLAHVAWKRFWLPREVGPQLDGQGYFADPEGEYGKLYKPKARTLEELDEKPCLALLGEPGIGKSHVVREYWRGLKARVVAEGAVVYIDCRWHHDLNRALFDTAAFRRWREERALLWLVVDSLDEYPAGPAAAASRILGELWSGPAEALRLRVACRTAEWPAVLDQQLPQLWGSAGDDASSEDRPVAFYALAPLRRVDVAAVVKGDATALFAEVERVRAEPLAIKPITLGFLLTEFGKHRKLPPSSVELYEKGCAILCEEGSRSREGSRRKGTLNAAQRLAIASRIAAVSILCRRSFIYLGPDVGTVPPEAILLEELSGGTELSRVGEVEVNDAALREVLEVSGLFAPRGADLVGGAHQTYAEFLAARFLRQRGLPAEQLLGEVLSPVVHRTVPVLLEMAAWLASQDKGVFQGLLDKDPLALLGSDFAMVGTPARESLVAALLTRIEQQEVFDLSQVYMRAELRRLDHPRLVEQLRPWIEDRRSRMETRRTAIRLATVCKVEALAEILAEVALNPNEDDEIRRGAAEAVAEIGSRAAKLRLKPLLSGGAGPDPEEELKGWALRALWPEHLTVGELFAHLTLPKNTTGVGAYERFIDDLGRGSVAYLSDALKWTVGLPSLCWNNSADDVQRLMGRFLALGWDRILDPHVCGPLAEAVRQRLVLKDEVIFGEEDRASTDERRDTLGEDDARRRLLTSALMALPPFEHEEIAHEMNGFIRPQDVPWGIAQLSATTESAQRARWVAVLRWLLLRNRTAEVLDPILAALDKVEGIGQVLPYGDCRKVDLGSPESRWMRREDRRQHKERRKYERIGPRRKQTPPDAGKRIRRCLKRFAAGDQRAGWQLQGAMMLDRDKKTYAYERRWKLVEFPGWLRADEATRVQILDVGRQYLLRADGAGGSAFEYRYLLLVDELDPEWLDMHAGALWRRDALIRLLLSGYDQSKHNSRLVARAYQAEPERVLETLRKLLDRDHEVGDEPYTLTRISDCWDERLGQFVLDFARHPGLKPKFLGALLARILELKVEGGLEYVVSLLASPVPAAGVDQLRRHAAAHAILTQGLESGWGVLRPLMQADPAFGREVFLTVAAQMDWGSPRTWAQGLSTDDTTDVYLWFEHQFPSQEDPHRPSGVAFDITTLDKIASIRHQLSGALMSRPDAAVAFERIHRAFPDLDLTWQMHLAKQSAAQGSWTPRTPREIIELRPTAASGSALAEGDLNMESTVSSPADIVILCAVGDLELEWMKLAGRKEWTELPTTSLDPHSYYGTTYTTTKGAKLRVVAAAPNQMGMAASAVLATKMIIRFRPTLVAMVGIAGGVPGNGRNLGDVLAAEHTFDYGSGKVKLEGDKVVFHPDPKPLDVDHRLLSRLHHWKSNRASVLSAIHHGFQGSKPDTTLKLHVGPLASGAAVVDAKERVDEIGEHWRKLVGLEMEAYAVHRACKDTIDPARKFLCLKAISDFAQNKDDNWRHYAAYTAAELCYRFLIEEWENLSFPER